MPPEYDAFGRPVRPASGGGAGPARSSTPTTPPRRSSSDGDAPRRPSPDPFRRRRSLGCLPLIAIVVVLVGALVPIVVGGGDDDGSSATDAGPTLVEPGRSGERASRESARTDEAARRAAGDADEFGMLSTAGTTAAFARLQAKLRPGERLTSLSIRPEHLSARVATGEGAPERSITIREDDDFESDGGTSRERGLALEAVDLRGPAKLVAATRRGLGPGSRATVGYVVLDVGDGPDEPPSWAVYLEGTPSEEARWTGDIHGDRVLRPSDGAPAPPPGRSGPAKAPAGVTGSSMVRPENLRRAIALVRAKLPDGSLVTQAAVRPTQVSVRARRSFRERTYTVDAAFGLQVGETRETTSRDGVPISSLNWRGPERALRKVDARQGNGAPGRVDYVILSPRSKVFPRSRTVWLVYLKGGHPNGRYWRATADGTRIGRAGEAGAP